MATADSPTRAGTSICWRISVVPMASTTTPESRKRTDELRTVTKTRMGSPVSLMTPIGTMAFRAVTVSWSGVDNRT